MKEHSKYHYSKNNHCECGQLISDYSVRCSTCNIKHLFKIGKIRSDGEYNSNFKGGLPKCMDCGKELHTRGCKGNKPLRCQSCWHKFSVGDNGTMKGKHHSEKTKRLMSKNRIGKYTGRKSPRFGKVAAHGKGKWFKNNFMRSTWEVAYAKYLTKKHVKWLYEPKAFDLGNTTYRPDFFLPKSNEYIEIKGYWRDDAKTKFKLFKRLFSTIKIIVLQEKELKSMGVL